MGNLSEGMAIDNKSFIISKENSSFSKIIFEIAQFSNVGGANKFKIYECEQTISVMISNQDFF